MEATEARLFNEAVTEVSTGVPETLGLVYFLVFVVTVFFVASVFAVATAGSMRVTLNVTDPEAMSEPAGPWILRTTECVAQIPFCLGTTLSPSIVILRPVESALTYSEAAVGMVRTYFILSLQPTGSTVNLVNSVTNFLAPLVQDTSLMVGNVAVAASQSS